jgi:hypothetical protein
MSSGKYANNRDSVVDPQAPSWSSDVFELKKDLKNKALNIVAEMFPQKIAALTNFIETSSLLNYEVSEVRQALVFPVSAATRITTNSTSEISTDIENSAPITKKRKLETDKVQPVHDASMPKEESHAHVASNKIVTEVLDSLKKELLILLEYLSTVKLWIQLNVPRIEDGNNFGVGIQEEVLNELGRAEDAAFTAIDAMTKYYMTRARLVAKWLKHPAVEDYRQAVTELDEKEYIDLRLAWKDLRNNYAVLYDMILKNFEKIVRPRSSDKTASLY